MSFDLAPLWSLAELINTPTPPQGELVSLDRIQGGTGRLNNEESSSTAEGRAFNAGDVLFGKLRPYLAKYWLADKDGTAQGDIHIYHPSSETDPRFLAYLVGSNEFVRLADAASTGTKMPRVEWSKVAQFQVPAPARTAQHAIADYLDRETAEIDGMRADLDKMERLLMERRESLFVAIVGNEATEVRVAVTSLLITGSTPNGGRLGAKDRPEKGLPWLRPEDLDDEHASKAIKLTPAESETVKALPANTPLFCGIGATVGKAGFANQKCATNQQITALVPHPGFDARYLFRALQAKQHEIRETAPSSTLKIVNNQRLGAQKVPFFPFAEQRRIADKIDRETAEIDSMLSDITKLRDLLAERRAALISAAVTGQIDIPVSPADKDETHA